VEFAGSRSIRFFPLLPIPTPHMSAANSTAAFTSRQRLSPGVARFNCFVCAFLQACAQAHEDGEGMVQSVHMLQKDHDCNQTQALIQLAGKMQYGKEDPWVTQVKAQSESFDADYIEDSNNPLEKFTRGNGARESNGKVWLIEDDGVDNFNCTAGIKTWRRGWSMKKKRFCCRTEGVGCELNSTNASGNDSRFNFSGNSSGGNESGIGTNRTNGTESNRSSGNTMNAMNVTFGNVTNATGRLACVTKDDPRANSFAYTTSPPGTRCVFGVDERDEGWHCILDDGDDYGSYGWCFTSKSRDTWGACSETCPLVGQAKQIGNMIRGAREEIKKTIAQEVRKAVDSALQNAIQMVITEADAWLNQTNGSFQLNFTGGGAQTFSAATSNSSNNSNSSNGSNINDRKDAASNGKSSSTNATDAGKGDKKKSDKKGSDKAAKKNTGKKG